MQQWCRNDKGRAVRFGIDASYPYFRDSRSGPETKWWKCGKLSTRDSPAQQCSTRLDSGAGGLGCSNRKSRKSSDVARGSDGPLEVQCDDGGEEKRIDGGKAYTWDDFNAYYKKKYSKKEIYVLLGDVQDYSVHTVSCETIASYGRACRQQSAAR